MTKTEDLEAQLEAERLRNDRMERILYRQLGVTGEGALDRYADPDVLELSREQQASVPIIAELHYDGTNADEIRDALTGWFTVNEDRVSCGGRNVQAPWPLCLTRHGFTVTVRRGEDFAIDRTMKVHVGAQLDRVEWLRDRQRQAREGAKHRDPNVQAPHSVATETVRAQRYRRIFT